MRTRTALFPYMPGAFGAVYYALSALNDQIPREARSCF